MKYKNDTDDLIQSDLEELRKQEPPKSAEGSYSFVWSLPIISDSLVIDTDGELKALILEFCLPTATYATMLLREVFKGDTSASSQMKLESDSVATGLSEKRKLEDNCEDDEELNSVKKVKTLTEDDVNT